MSYINFESAKLKEDLRNEKRKAREAVLEKAEAAYKKRKDREQRAHERGEDKWMLPSLDAQLQHESKMTKKKHKKEKKKKKEKKQKSKSKKDSSGSSDSSDAEEWVEKGVESSSGSPSAPVQRDSWMTLPALFPCISRDQIRAQKRQETPLDEETMKKKFLLDNPGQSERELNPFWKDGGQGLPQVEEPQPDSLSLPTNSAGDHGLAWLRRALRRVQEQAKEEGRSEEAVASERWGSLTKLKSMLSEAERRCRTKARDGGRGRSHRGGRVQGPAPRPREYEDWREDPTAGENASSQSEAVGDKSRYRSWLGLKDPSPQKEPSSDEEDDFDCNQLDDPPTVEGMVLKENNEKDHDSISVVKKDCSEDDDNDDEANGKIIFRSSKTRKRNPTAGNFKCDVKGGLHPFGRKSALKSTGSHNNEIDSEDEDKLFEEWRNERTKKDSDESDNELENIKTLGAKKETEIEEKTVKAPTDKQHIDNPKGSEENCKKLSSSTSYDFQEKLFQIQNKGSAENILKEEKGVKNRRDCEYRESSHEHDVKKDRVMTEDPRNASKERRDSNEPKMEKTNRNERERSREFRYRDRERNEREDRKGKGKDKEKIESFYKDRERASEERSRNHEVEGDKSKSEHRREFYDERRTNRANESRQVIRDGGRRLYEENKFTRRGDECDDSEYRDRHRSGRDQQAGPRRSDIPDYLRKRRTSPLQCEKTPSRRLGGFRKPEENASDSQKHLRSDILGSAVTIRESSSGKKNWMKKEFQKTERKVEPKPEIISQKSDSKPSIPVQKVDVKEKEEEKEYVQMSDADMNALGAKVLKAELLGNHDLAARLKKQLEQAQANRQRTKVASIAGSVTSKQQDEEVVLLTRRDAKGFVRPVEAPSHSEPSGGRRRPQHVATHGADGLRERFFPDDDKYSLENMFQKEKLTTIEDANEEFSRLASKSAGHAESEYDLDDIFAEKMSREKAPGKLQALERNRAIREHKRVERSLDSCIRCFDSPRMLKHLLIALGSKVYLSLPAHQSLTEGHCLLAPIHHVPCATQLDEDVWEEMTSFRKALVSMFSKEDQDCVFFESAMHLRRFPHMVLECVPLPREVGDTAPIYFKKAIMESEMEWSMNKKLVDLKSKGVRRAVPKGLPYFAVDFGNDDGFAHVIEDEKLFPENFAQEIIGGMLDLDHSLWRKKRFEDFNTQRKKVLQFAELWKRFDVTKHAAPDSSSSSSESDRE